MSGPFTPPTRDTAVVPPNRVPPPSRRATLWIWLLLMVLFVATYNLFQAPRPERAPRPPESSEGTPVGWVIPLATYLAMGLALLRVRARLPARFRTGELREVARAAPEPVAPIEAPPIDLSFTGTHGQGPVTLGIDDSGLHWRAEARVLQPARELDVPWSELEAISTARVPGPLVVWGVLIAVGSLSMISVEPFAAVSGAVIGLAIAAASGRLARGSLSFTTASHALVFVSRALTTQAQDDIMAAARARCPRAVAPASEPSRSALFVLFIEPFTLLASTLQDDEGLRAPLLRQGSIKADPRFGAHDGDESQAGMVQVRLFGIWRGVLCGLGPVSMGVGAAFGYGSPAGFLVGWFPAYVAGFVVLARTISTFARFSGMGLIR